MLNKHLHILVPEQLYTELVKQAEKADTSMGSLVRDALVLSYMNQPESKKEQRKALMERIAANKKKFGGLKNVDYRSLIEDGRRI